MNFGICFPKFLFFFGISLNKRSHIMEYHFLVQNGSSIISKARYMNQPYHTQFYIQLINFILL